MSTERLPRVVAELSLLNSLDYSSADRVQQNYVAQTLRVRALPALETLTQEDFLTLESNHLISVFLDQCFRLLKEWPQTGFSHRFYSLPLEALSELYIDPDPAAAFMIRGEQVSITIPAARIPKLYDEERLLATAAFFRGIEKLMESLGYGFSGYITSNKASESVASAYRSGSSSDRQYPYRLKRSKRSVKSFAIFEELLRSCGRAKPRWLSILGKVNNKRGAL